ncbi:MAG: DNA gyrase/topoisomerase IV subunit A, partial [Spirosomataceae bacterium]
GRFLGNFGPTDQILVIYKDGTYELTNFDLTNHYEPSLVVTIGKFAPDLIVTALYYDGAQKTHYIKRFMIETSTADKKFLFISDARGSKLVLASLDKRPRLQLTLQKAPKEPMVTEEYLAEDMVEVRGWRALGNKIAAVKLKEGIWLEPLPEEEKNETQEPPPVEGDEEPDQGNEKAEEKAKVELNEPAMPTKEEEVKSVSQEKKMSTKKNSNGADQTQLGLFE